MNSHPPNCTHQRARMDQRAFELRHQQYMADYRYFAERLKKIIEVMPHPGFVVSDGRVEWLPPDPKWQEAIDSVIAKWWEYAKAAYPEFNIVREGTASTNLQNRENVIYETGKDKPVAFSGFKCQGLINWINQRRVSNYESHGPYRHTFLYLPTDFDPAVACTGIAQLWPDRIEFSVYPNSRKHDIGNGAGMALYFTFKREDI